MNLSKLVVDKPAMLNFMMDGSYSLFLLSLPLEQPSIKPKYMPKIFKELNLMSFSNIVKINEGMYIEREEESLDLKPKSKRLRISSYIYKAKMGFVLFD